MADKTNKSNKKVRGGKADVKEAKTQRLTLRMSEKEADILKYWADKEGISRSDFMSEALMHYVGFLNHDFDIPSATVERLNQLIDVISLLASNQENLESTIIDGFDSILGISRGANYLLDEDGEL